MKINPSTQSTIAESTLALNIRADYVYINLMLNMAVSVYE